MKLAVIFNGQGAQYPGMGLDFAEHYDEAKKVYQVAEEVTGYPIREWIEEDQEVFKQTRHAQPGIAATSLAIYNSIAPKLNSAVQVMAGLSLGEYSALIASNMLSLEEGFSLLKKRGDIMSRVCEKLNNETNVQMLAVMLMPFEEIETLVEEISTDSPLYIANINSNNQVILAGTTEATKAFRKEARARGYRRVMPLKVEGPFHSPLMEEARESYEPILEETNFQKGKIPVVSNVNLEVNTVDNVRDHLSKHMTQPVQWKQTIDQFMAQGITHVIQIGPGNTLGQLIERDQLDLPVLVIDKVDDVARIQNFLNGGH